MEDLLKPENFPILFMLGFAGIGLGVIIFFGRKGWLSAGPKSESKAEVAALIVDSRDMNALTAAIVDMAVVMRAQIEMSRSEKAAVGDGIIQLKRLIDEIEEFRREIRRSAEKIG